MIQPMYRKGNRLAWIGFGISIVFLSIEILGESFGGSPPLVPSLSNFVLIASLIEWVGLGILFWASVLVLKSKNRSLWWLLVFILAFMTVGAIAIGVIFILKDKPIASVSNSTAPNTIPNVQQKIKF